MLFFNFLLIRESPKKNMVSKKKMKQHNTVSNMVFNYILLHFAYYKTRLTQVLVSMPKCSKMVKSAKVVMGVPHVNKSTSEST